MRFGHLADVHAGHRQYGLKRRESDMVDSLRATLAQQLEAGVGAILISGDLFHDRDLRPRVLADVEETLSSVPEGVPVLVIRGNHDENLTPRDHTWLEYLDERGGITLLEANLDTDSPSGMFPAPVHGESSTGQAGHIGHNRRGYVDLPTDGLGPVRVFGLQYRGGYIDSALERAGEAIATINDQERTPSMTILMAHFGMSDEVPDLGGRVSDAALSPVRDEVDYLALGHIHKQYERDWAFNPGSPEAHSTAETKWDSAHGHYIVDVGAGPNETVTDSTNTTAAGIPFAATHHLSKRRPFHRIDVDISSASTFDGVASLVETQIRDETDAIEASCQPERFRTNDGDRRPPVLDIRLQGTLQFERRDLDTDRLSDIVYDVVEALHVQLTDHTETVAIQELMDDVDQEAVFDSNGTLNIQAVEDQVFETIVNESPYSDEVEVVVSLLRDIRREVSAGDRTNLIENVSTLVSDTRREAFAGGVDEDLDVDIDVEVPPSPVEQAQQAETPEVTDASSGGADGTGSRTEVSSESGRAASKTGEGESPPAGGQTSEAGSGDNPTATDSDEAPSEAEGTDTMEESY